MKSHYEVLDGLRGVAALSVFIFHILEMTVFPPENNPLWYAYLAVDFFFVLSGFVLGYSYDKRLSLESVPVHRLDFWGFFRRRLIRLHPLIIIGMILGLAGYVAGPYIFGNQLMGGQASSWLLMLNIILGLLALPAPTLPACFGMTHSLNGPAWSLTQEYLASIFYGLFGRRIGRSLLGVIWFASAMSLLFICLHYGHLNLGVLWSNFWIAPIRVCVSFSVGLLLYRLNLKFKTPVQFFPLAVVLVAVFAAPQVIMKSWHGIYDAVCVLVVFPAIVVAGIGVKSVTGFTGNVCRLMGRLSYPVYIIHYPFLLLIGLWNWNYHPSRLLLWSVAAGVFVGSLIISWLFLTFYDEPVREWLLHGKGEKLKGEKILLKEF